MPIDGGPSAVEMGLDPAEIAGPEEVNPAPVTDSVVSPDPKPPSEAVPPVGDVPVAELPEDQSVDGADVGPESATSDAQSGASADVNIEILDSAIQEFLNIPRAEQIGRLFTSAKQILERSGIEYDSSTSADPSVAITENRRNLLRLLKTVPSDSPDYEVAKSTYEEISKDMQLIGQNGEAGNLSDLEIELESPTLTPDRKAVIEGLIRDGKYTTSYDPAPEADATVVTEIQKKSMDAYEARLAQDIKDIQDKDPKADVEKLQNMLDLVRGAKTYTGKPLADYVMGDAIRVLNAYYKDIPEAEGLQLSPVEAARVEAARTASRDLLLKNMEAAGMPRHRADAILDLGDGGNMEEMLKNFDVFKVKNVAQLITGREFKNQEEATKFMTELFGQLEQEKYKKLKGMSFFAIVAIVAASAFKDFAGGAITPGGQR